MSSVAGLRILILEDEAIIALSLEDAMMDAGAVPVVADTIDRASELLAQEDAFDAAVLDVNVNGKQSYDIARNLAARGTPFIFATGYGDAVIPPDLAHVRTMPKPYDMQALTQALGR